MSDNKIIGLIGILMGFFCLGSFLAGDNSKLIIPISDFFLIKYFLIICIFNVGLYFIVAGVLILMRIFDLEHAKTNIEYEKIKAKGILLSAFFLSPFLSSFFITVFGMSESLFWKILGSLALAYITWTIYFYIKVLKA